jgi:predicted lactoylglutathione lyase
MSKKGLFIFISVLFFLSCHPQKKHSAMKTRFTVLTLGVDDLETSFQFYHRGLGFPSQGIIGKEFEHGEVAFFDLPHGMKLALYSRENLAWDAKIEKQAPSTTEFSIGYTTNNQTEVDEIMALAKKTGAKIVKPAQKAFWGGYSGYFQDPDGHLWEIAWNPQLMPED